MSFDRRFPGRETFFVRGAKEVVLGLLEMDSEPDRLEVVPDRTKQMRIDCITGINT